PATLRVPFNATPGAYRVSILLDNATLGSATFNVTALPTLADLSATPDNDALVVNAAGAGEGVLVVEIRDGAQASRVEAAYHQGALVRVAPPTLGRALSWNATLYARAGGAPLAWREGAWVRAAPELGFRLERGLPRLPAAWNVSAPGWDLAHANATLALARWDGSPEPALHASFDGSRLVVEGPSNVAPGRYAASLHLRFPNGTEADATLPFEAGPWVRVTLGAATVSGRGAILPVANEGGLAVRRLVAEVEGPANLTLQVGNATYAPTISPTGRLVFEGLTLAPGAGASLVARLPEGPLAAGSVAVRVRLVALPGGSG